MLKLFQTLAPKLMKDIYVTLATFLTQLKKLYKNIKIIQVSLSSKKWYPLPTKITSFPSSLLLQMISQQIKRLDINKATQEMIYLQSL